MCAYVSDMKNKCELNCIAYYRKNYRKQKS